MWAASGISPASFKPVLSLGLAVCIVPLYTGCIVPALWSAAGSQRSQVRYIPSQVCEVITEPSVLALQPTMMEVQFSPFKFHSHSWAFKHKIQTKDKQKRNNLLIFIIL